MNTNERNEEQGEFKSPITLNEEFRAILAAIPAVQLSMTGTVMDTEGTDPLDLSDEEQAIYRELTGKPFDSRDYAADLFAEMARGALVTRKRSESIYTYALLAKAAPLLPHVKGTSTFGNYYIPRELKRSIVDGVSNGGTTHMFYGDDKGGIFNPFSVEPIEERSLRILSGDIKWYGVSYMGMPIPGTSDQDLDYKDMIQKGKTWVKEFRTRYKRPARDIRGGVIEIS